MALTEAQERLLAEAEAGQLPPLKQGSLKAMALGLVGQLSPDELRRVAAASKKQEGSA